MESGITLTHLLLTIFGAGVAAAIPMIGAGVYGFIKLSTKFDIHAEHNALAHEKMVEAQEKQNGQLDQHSEAIAAIVATCAERARLQKILVDRNVQLVSLSQQQEEGEDPPDA